MRSLSNIEVEMCPQSLTRTIALVSMVIIIVSVLFRSVAVDQSLRGSSSDMFSIVKPGVFQAIGVISFAYACHHNSNYIYKSINIPTLDRYVRLESEWR